MASSLAMIEALGDNKNSNVIDGGMDALPTAPLPFFNQQFNFSERNAQSSSSSSNLGVNNLNNLNDNYNNDDINL